MLYVNYLYSIAQDFSLKVVSDGAPFSNGIAASEKKNMMVFVIGMYSSLYGCLPSRKG